MKYKLAIFDLDGTLFDTKDVNYRAYREAIGNVDIDYEFYCKFCNGRNYKQFLPIIMPDITDERMEEIHDLKKQLYPGYLKYARKNEELFGKFENINALVTTASLKNTMDILSEFNVTDVFDFIITQEDVKETKPNPECFLLAMEKAGAMPNETIIYEDSDAGIEAAKKSGADYVIVEGFN